MVKRSPIRASLGNAEVAALLDEIADLLKLEGANPFRVGAYRKAAVTIRGTTESLALIFQRDGVAGLRQLPGVGSSLSGKIGEIFRNGKSRSLERLRRRHACGDLLTSLPAVGPTLADRIRTSLGSNSLEQVFVAACNGRLRRIPGLGRKRVQAIRESLAIRLDAEDSSRSQFSDADDISVADLLAIDRQYRSEVVRGRLPTVAPKHFNPTEAAWLPLLRTRRHGRRFCAHYANTAHSHRFGRAHDWVVIYCEDKQAFGRWTVVTAAQGALRTKRVVKGRERECQAHYRRYQQTQLSLPPL